MNCKHCESIVDAGKCDTCNKTFRAVAQCKTCHNEVVHDIIVDQNIHICSSSGATDFDDHDAFAKADEQHMEE